MIDAMTSAPAAAAPSTQRRSRRSRLWLLLALPLVVALALGVRTSTRYATAPTMAIAINEVTNNEYPEDPADRSLYHGQYQGRSLSLVQQDETHFDFIFEPTNPRVARIVVKNVDVSLMTPSLPDWVRGDEALERIALTDRQWNRQQVRFSVGSPQLEITGGDGFEREQVATVELAKNCLNAGLWEILLFAKNGDSRQLYYQGWFTFPLGHYRTLFERNTGLSYWGHWSYLEHWRDPEGAPMALDKLRRVSSETQVQAVLDPNERLIAGGEQLRKRRITVAPNVTTWGDFYHGSEVRFARFVPPGRYAVADLWGNEYVTMDRFEKAIHRQVQPAGGGPALDELELVFGSSQGGETRHFLVSGFDARLLPQLPVADYSKGLYMPMGIGVPPFVQGVTDLEKNPPHKSPYFSLLLDGEGRWINHHRVAVDGPVIHRDATDPNLLHVYLLSYERSSLVGHWKVVLPAPPGPSPSESQPAS